jgi:phosphate starvation-inducible protein PhoH
MEYEKELRTLIGSTESKEQAEKATMLLNQLHQLKRKEKSLTNDIKNFLSESKSEDDLEDETLTISKPVKKNKKNIEKTE